MFTPAQCSAARANPSATTSCAPNFARLFSPSERRPRDLYEVVRKPIEPGRDVTMITRNPARVNGARPACPTR